VSLHEEKQEVLASIKSMREWVLEGEHIFDGSWAKQPEEITNAEVGRRFDAYLARLSCFLEAEERTEDEKLRLGHLLKALTHLRPGTFTVTISSTSLAPIMRWNERFVRSRCSIAASVDAKTGTIISYDMDAVLQAQEWWMHQPNGEVQLQARLQQVVPSLWRQVRQETRDCHQEQLNRYRFRHRPLDYLASLEMRWEQTTGT